MKPEVLDYTLVQLLQLRAQETPDQLAYRYLIDGEREEVKITYAELNRRVKLLAAQLDNSKMKGQRAALLFPPGLEFIVAFFACLYAGVIAVPAYMPRSNRNGDRVFGILNNSQPCGVLTDSKHKDKLQQQLKDWRSEENSELIYFTENTEQQETEWLPQKYSKDELAFLQYTSGSTSDPKGVMITHGNIIHNLNMIAHSFGLSKNSIGMSWLPPYHDMGLIGGILEPLFIGFEVTLMSPFAFIERPIRWLEAIDRYRVTVSGAPNFAYDLCADRKDAEGLEKLDLSSWKVAFCGAEQIRQTTLEKFSERYACNQFSAVSFLPCYGLAESTLMVTGGLPDQSYKVLSREGNSGNTTKEFIGCGQLLLDQKVIIVNHETGMLCNNSEVGEVWVYSTSMAKGYWNNPAETDRVFNVKTKTGEGPFLRTGDLGFISDGELFVTGRLKDLIIVNGRNYYPQDIEFTVEHCHPFLAGGRAAAFSLNQDSGAEKLYVVAELRRDSYRKDTTEVIQTIRSAVSEEHMLAAHGIILVKPASVPKTSSGKIQRYKCREQLETGELSIVSADIVMSCVREEAFEFSGNEEASDVNTGDIRDIVCTVLSIDKAVLNDLSRPLLEIGLDSITTAQLGEAFNRQYGVRLPIETILGGSVVTIYESIVQLLQSQSIDEVKGSEQSKWINPLEDRPATEAEQKIWYLHTLDHTKVSYNVAFMLMIEGELDVDIFVSSVEHILNHHAAFKSTFASEEGELKRKYHPDMPVQIMCVELDGSMNNLREAAKEQSMKNAAKAFDLTAGPLFHAEFYRISNVEYILSFVAHHIVADGLSYKNIAGEISSLYKASILGQANQEIKVQSETLINRGYYYPEHQGDQASEFWENKLQEAPPMLELPLDYPRPPIKSFTGDTITFSIQPDVIEGLRSLGNEHQATLFMTLLSAYGIILSRYSSQSEVLVGVPFNGREEMEFNDVGMYVNTLPVLLDCKPELTFSQLLLDTKQTIIETQRYQSYSYHNSRKASSIEGSSNERIPSIQTVFLLEEDYSNALLIEDTRISCKQLPNGTSKFDLSLRISTFSDHLEGNLEFDTDIFTKETIERIAANFTTLLHSVAADAHEEIGLVNILHPEEKSKILIDFNDTRKDFGPFYSVCELIQQTAVNLADTTALIVGDIHYTYGEINRRSNQLAHYLRRIHGIQAGSIVGIYLERSADMVIGLLGILKAGGAYLPLDPNYPSDMIRVGLQDCSVDFILTKSSLMHLLTDIGINKVCMDSEDYAIKQESDERFYILTAPEHLAYVLMTSGTTGRPKLIAVQHRSLSALMHWVRDYFSADDLKGVLGANSISFDISLLELFGVMSSGGCIILAQNVMDIKDLPYASHIRTMFVIPSIARELVHIQAIPDSVRNIYLGGEYLPKALVKKLYDNTCVKKVYNMYGPSEDTMITTIMAEPVARENNEEIPIGVPILNEQVYILDAYMNPVPIGAKGEIYIGGSGVADGYLNRPELTQKMFVADPFSKNAFSRLYKTGDLARYLPDGSIMYIGRKDSQIKLRGARIDLNEIENVLSDYPGVEECIVCVKELKGHTYLAAFFIGSNSQRLDNNDINNYLSRKLPVYMLPSTIIQMESFPLMGSGKIDYNKLVSEAKIEDATQKNDFILPQSATQETLLRYWSDLLRTDRISIRDNFFYIGGHSLRAMQLISRIKENFGIEVTLRTLFDHPTIELLAKCLDEQKLDSGAVHDGQQMMIDSNSDVLMFSAIQQSLWFLSQLDTNSRAYNIPLALSFKGALDIGLLEKSLEQIIQDHEVLRWNVVDSMGIPQIYISHSKTFMLKRIDISSYDEVEKMGQLQRIMEEESIRFIALDQGPLLHATLIEEKKHHYILFLNIHHISFDGWSLEILLRDLLRAYVSLQKGISKPACSQQLQYKHYSQWQHQWLQSDEANKQEAFWIKELAQFPDTFELPLKKGSFNSGNTGVNLFRVFIPERITSTLQALARECNVTMFTILMAGFQTILYRYSFQEKFLVGTSLSGRTQIAWEDMIGCFVNTLPVKADFTKTLTFRELIVQVQETMVDVQSNQDMPFEKIVDSLGVKREPSRNPLVQIMFNLQKLPETSFPEINTAFSVELLESKYISPKFDLDLSVMETGEGLLCTYSFQAERYEESAVRHLSVHYERLLESVADNADQTMSSISFLSCAEIEQLRLFSNDSCTDYAGPSLIEKFERQVSLTPQRIAVHDGEHELTFEQLNRRANKLAQVVIAHGINPEDAVGVCVQRSVNWFIAVLGILKAGGAFVPVDPTLPVQRKQFITSNSNMRLLLTQKELVSMTKDLPVPFICLDDADLSSDCAGEINPSLTRSLSNPTTYILYTSGSTGQPKGVMVGQNSVMALLDSLRNEVKELCNDGCKIGLHASLMFDASIQQWIHLIEGQTLYIVPEEIRSSTLRWIDYVNKNGLSVIDVTPTYLEVLFQTGMSSQSFQRPLTVLVGGEAISPALWKTMVNSKPLRFFNMYGPTECTVDSTCCLITEELSAPTIGRPLPHAKINIVDSKGQLVPIGVAGQICIGGAGVAKGYVSSKLTEKSFSYMNLYGTNERIYQTGDCGSWRADGHIDFSGRLDRQVKLHGYRIELDEINTLLNEHPAVSRAFTKLLGEEIRTVLVTYVESSESPLPEEKELQIYLQQRLPVYMIPQHILVLSTFPLNNSGKLDEQALPKPELPLDSILLDSEVPKTEIERRVQEIWMEVLKVKPFSITTNFFELGGNSLTAMQIIARMSKEFSIQIPIKNIFEAPNVKEISQWISQVLREKEERELEQLISEVEQLSDDEITLRLSQYFEGQKQEVVND